MRTKILIVSLLAIASNVFSGTTFEFNLGFGIGLPVSTISNFYNTALDIGEKLNSVDRDKVVQDFADMVNIAKAGFGYGGHAQMGARFDHLLSLGFELGFDFNLFKAINRTGKLNDSFSFIAAIEPRFYTRLDFFIGAIAFFTGPRVNIATAREKSILNDLGIFAWDLGTRLTFSFLMLEAYYSWNIKKEEFSDFKVGLGVEFGIL
ncbi:hypothetical protein CR532_02845 [Candidatus Borreliella tachyglossi]|uniref:Outer membrane protein beta-barrel domain-containing protein n=1 Tax=Candidatus Borreliella tachyglossi TaxID=1964448 RepID=A0A2S1LXA4_9SPIR|nr:hypothetical protein [Candidatus Borreliella tachyglossi]AWG42910.1 hypothetical protein CR532_02845 [Candidatus Borreliella tachyglossi]